MNTLLKLLLTQTVGGGVLALVLLAVQRILGRKLPSTFYYYAWLLVLLRFLLPIPGWIPYEQTLPRMQQTAVVAGENLRPAVAQGKNMARTPSGAIEGEKAEEELPEALPPGEQLPGEPEELEVPEVQTAAYPVQTVRRMRPAGWLALTWACGAAVCLGFFLFSYGFFLRALKKTLKPAGGEEYRMLHNLSSPRRLNLCRSGALYSPIQLGLLRPKLVLPERSYSEEMLQNILRHELTHFQRHDILYKWFAVFVCAIHWFNPVLWLIRRELDRACELSCDERLLRTMSAREKQSYGETLLALAGDRCLPRRVIATSFATEKRNLKERLEQIMNYKAFGKRTVALALCAVFLLCGVALAAGPARAEEGVPSASVPTGAETAPAPEAPENGTQSPLPADAEVVNTVDALLAAIRPGANIVLAEGEYNLTKAADYGKVAYGAGEYYYWGEEPDGYGLAITGVTNLTIQAMEGATVSIVTEPRYADVLRFEGCEGVTVANVTVGHTTAPSECAGGVLSFQRTDNVTVDNCRLFGCGTVGVITWDSRNVLVTNTDIYSCSQGAAVVERSWNFQIDRCEIYGCRGNGLFQVVQSEEVAFTNSHIYSNQAELMVSSEANSRGVFLGGLLVEQNRFASGLYGAEDEPIVFTGCDIATDNIIPNGFAGCSKYWETSADPIRAVSPDGSEMTDADLGFLSQKQVTWTALDDVQQTLSKEPDSDGKIHVSTVDELLAALGSDRWIYMEPGNYDLTTASDYGRLTWGSYNWWEEFDGYSLVLLNVSGLTIEGAGVDQVNLETVPRYADVLRLVDCQDITLKGFTAGHTVDMGSCSGDVLELRGCDRIQVEDCSLFGCGVIGINAYFCTDLEVKNAEIHHCENSAASLSNCVDVTFTECDIHDNGVEWVLAYGWEFSAVYLGDCDSVTFTGCNIHDNGDNRITDNGCTNVTIQ